MRVERLGLAVIVWFGLTGLGLAQSPAPAAEPASDAPPHWDLELGVSYFGTSGNSTTSSAGANFAHHLRHGVWHLEVTGSALRASNDGKVTAAHYIGAVRGERDLSSLLGVSIGEHAERDSLAGVALRNVLDTSLSWAIVRSSRGTVDVLTGLAVYRERSLEGRRFRHHPVGLLQVAGRMRIGTQSELTSRLTGYPDLDDGSESRLEAEMAAEAALNSHFSLKLADLLQYSRAPALGFRTTDNTVTASVEVKWRGTP